MLARRRWPSDDPRLGASAVCPPRPDRWTCIAASCCLLPWSPACCQCKPAAGSSCTGSRRAASVPRRGDRRGRMDVPLVGLPAGVRSIENAFRPCFPESKCCVPCRVTFVIVCTPLIYPHGPTGHTHVFALYKKNFPKDQVSVFARVLGIGLY